jgi:glucan phosphoethanolaminetransferase (alkaline phosphatase superfamily)
MPPVDFIHNYFIGEKRESYLFMVLGIVALVAAILFFFIGKTNIYKGAAIPLILIGLLHIIVGYTVYKRSDAQRIDMAYQYGIANNQAPASELSRMDTVMKNFVIYRYVEIALALIGVALIILFKNNLPKQFWLGFGIALAIEALVSLGADYFAEKRGYIYTNNLKQTNTNNKPLNPNSH